MSTQGRMRVGGPAPVADLPVAGAVAPMARLREVEQALAAVQAQQQAALNQQAALQRQALFHGAQGHLQPHPQAAQAFERE